MERQHTFRDILYFVIAFLCTSFVFYYGLSSLFGAIISMMATIGRVLPIVLSSFAALALYLMYFYKSHIRETKWVTDIIFSVIILISVAVSIVFLCMNGHYYFGSLALLIRPILLLLILILDLVGAGFILCHRRIILRPIGRTDQIGKGEYLGFSFLSCFATFFLFDFFVGLFQPSSYAENFFVYILLLLSFLVPTYNLFYMIFKDEKHFMSLRLSTVIINAIFLIVMSIFTTTPLLLPELSQNLLYLDYAASIAFGPIFLIAINIAFIIVPCIEIIRSYIPKPIDNERR